MDRSFIVNNNITLKLENDITNIYIDGKKFIQCKKLKVDIPFNEIESYNNIESIDQINGKMERDRELTEIPPEDEFWGHCSNIQTWIENNYDTSLLHMNIAFPLLKKLSNIGVKNTKFKLQEEIVIRLEGSTPSSFAYIFSQSYISMIDQKLVVEILKEKFKKHHDDRIIEFFNKSRINKSNIHILDNLLNALKLNVVFIIDDRYFEQKIILVVKSVEDIKKRIFTLGKDDWHTIQKENKIKIMNAFFEKIEKIDDIELYNSGFVLWFANKLFEVGFPEKELNEKIVHITKNITPILFFILIKANYYNALKKEDLEILFLMKKNGITKLLKAVLYDEYNASLERQKPINKELLNFLKNLDKSTQLKGILHKLDLKIKNYFLNLLENS